MTLRLPHRWVWDFWLAWDGSHHHAFYLQAPRSIGDPEQRHWNVSIGHAVSLDLETWEPVADALLPGPAGGFDDYTVWTGSVVRHGGRWVMLYTGTSHAERGLVQRIGLAVSDDLNAWRRHDEPVLTADPSRYETLDSAMWHDQAWRDPWLFFDPDDNHLHAIFTARSNHGARFDRGVIGHARSSDLHNWEIHDPMSTTTGFGQLEVPQLLKLEQHWYLLFCSDTETQSPQRRAAQTGTGTYYMIADSKYGPFEMIDDGVLDADESGASYAGKLHLGADGTVWYLAWDRVGPDGGFVGELAQPRRIEIRHDGSLALRERQAHR